MALLPLPQSTAVDSHRLDAPILRSTLPVQVKGTFNYALRTLKELSQVANQTSTTVVASIAVLILETAHSVRSCKDECLLLAMQISELVLLFSESDSQAGDMYEPLIDISVLIRTLSEVHDCQKKLTKRGFFIRALEVREVKAALKRHAQDIENAIQIFRTRSSLRMQRSIVRQVKSDAQNTEEFIEQLDVLRHEIEQAGALQTVSQLHILRPRNPLPSRPAIFFGRDDLVNTIIDSLIHQFDSHICILGPGGVGKSSLVLAALHDPRISTIFSDQIFFIPCDAASDLAGLVSVMSSYFGLQGEQLQDRLISLFRHGDHRKLLVLDNFESPWENMMRRGDVENFLSTLSGIKELGIIVTMRGAERPSGTLWSRPFLPMIAPYDRSAARDTFLAITDGDPHDPHLDILLDYADDLPLAVTLIAATAQYEPTSELVDRWKSDGTALADHGQHRKNSLDISIRITLESPRIARFPEALQVLSLLSLLPEGVELDDVRAFAPDVLKPEGAISILLGNALVFRVATGRLKVLAPLRNFIQHHHFPSSSAFWNLCKRYAEVASSANRIGYPGCGATYRKLGGEIGNIESLLVNSAEHEMPVLPLVEAIPPLCIFASLSGLGSIERLRCAIDLADDLQSPHLRASCFLGIARIQRIRGTDPTPFVEEAEALYRQLESTRGLADVDIFRGLTKVVLSGDHSDLIRTLEAALPSYDLSPDYRARCDCLIALGQRQIRQKLYSKAETTFHLALSESTQFSFLDGMGLAYYRLGTIYYFQSRFGAADEVYLKSSECFAQLPYAYGVTTGPTPEIPCMMNDYEEALCRSRDRRIVSKSQGWLRQGALSGLDIALAYIDLYRLDEAEEEIAEVRNAITEFHSAWEESLCDMLEGDIALQRGDLGASEKLYARSIEIYPPLRWEYYYRRTGDLAMAKNDTDKAFTQFLIGFLLARKSRVLINELKTGQIPCLRRIADIILEKSGRADIAEGVYWDLLGFTEFLGLRRESAGCFRGLGIVAKERGLESMAVKYWGRALKLSRDTQDSRAAEELERMAARLDVPETGKP